ncbi:MAG TPA: response regulator [Flavitalea sp.]|nr:response regulator [Flavitalea sp.]
MMHNRKVLLAEDDSDDREIFSDIFQGMDEEATLTMVENGMEIIVTLESITDPAQLPDLIVLDQNMPKMTGKQTLQWVKSNEKYNHIPIIIFSTYSDERLITECTRMGAARVITKPCSFDEYEQMVNDFLNEIVEKNNN